MTGIPMKSSMRRWEELRLLLRELSVRHGEFFLASGQKSSVYVDAKLTTCRAAAMPLIGRLFLDKISENGWHPSAVGGLTLGADPIATAIARESLEIGLNIDSFLVRKETKKHGRQKYLEGLEPVPESCQTGGSTITAIERSREAGLTVLGAICLVDREMGAAEAIGALACPFDRIFTLNDLLHDATPTGSCSAETLSGAGSLR
jgi:orotate phosphoribosyltransferase